MPADAFERKLVAILAADIAGYSRLVGLDEEGTLTRLRSLRREVIDPAIAARRGRTVKTTGDGMLVEFSSVVDAVRCAVVVQRATAEREAELPPDRRIAFRVGVNLGDIVVEGGDIFGDGVNIAARLEGIAEPGGICLSAAAHEQVHGKVELDFADLGEQSLRNISRPVHAYRALLDKAASVEPKALPLPDKPSIAVLPFQNMTGDSEQDYFVDGMVEEITTAIARLPRLFVIARNSAFAYKGKTIDVKQVAQQLGVGYLLEGSVRKSNNRVRITGQLIEATTGSHIWADRFDGALDDIFELQDRVASSVVGAVEPKLLLAEVERAKRKPAEHLDAYDLYLRALAQSYRYTEIGFGEAISLVMQALGIDRNYPPALAMFGWCRLLQVAQGWVSSASEDSAEAVKLAKEAIEAGWDDPEALWMAGATVIHLGGEHSTGAAAVERALALNPNCAHAWHQVGFLHCTMNRPEQAIGAIQRAMRLSPFDPLGYIFTHELAFAHMLAQRFDDAMTWVDRSLSEQPRFVAPVRLKLCLCGHLNRAEEGREWLARLRKLYPALTIAEFNAFRSRAFVPEVRAIYSEGLRKAGLPEA
jgi:adenylate cyclase